MKLFLVDLDNTLYPKESGVFDIINNKINEYMENVLNIKKSSVEYLRIEYWNKYGSTLTGLINHYGVNPEHFLEYVHDVDVNSLIKPNRDILKLLKDIYAVKIIFTNAPKEHAIRVLESLDIIDQFIDIFDIRSANFIGKPNKYPYQRVMELTKAKHYMMADDSKDNLKTAQQLGIFTIAVGNKTNSDADLHVVKFEDIPSNIF